MGKAPIPCPAGTFRDRGNGTALRDCFACPKGKVCPKPASVTYQNCPSKYFCANAGTANATACSLGRFCPSNTTVPLVCPAAHYCPVGVSKPLPCYRGTYCPPGTGAPIPCPLGYIGAASVNNTISVLPLRVPRHDPTTTSTSTSDRRHGTPPRRPQVPQVDPERSGLGGHRRVPQQRPGVGPPGPVFGQAQLDELGERGGAPGRGVVGPDHDLADEGALVGRVKRVPAGEALVEDHA